MRGTIDIDIQLDEACSDPKIIIRTRRKTQEIENIVSAIENCMENGYPMVPAYDGDITWCC